MSSLDAMNLGEKFNDSESSASDGDRLLGGDSELRKPRRWRPADRKHLLLYLSIGAATLLSILNVFVIMNWRPKTQQPPAINPNLLLSGPSTSQTMQTLTPFSSPNRSIANEAWDAYKINGFVALPHSWISDLTGGQGPFGRAMPHDPAKGIYVVDGLHQLHCLMSVRSLVQDLLDGNEMQNRTHVQRHLDHCYDALRQAIVCRADPTPLYMPPGDSFYSGDGQPRQCADWTALEAWTLQHTACYGGVECWRDEELQIVDVGR